MQQDSKYSRFFSFRPARKIFARLLPTNTAGSPAAGAQSSRARRGHSPAAPRAEYEAVRRAAEHGRRAFIEFGSEDEQLRGSQRAQLLALIRNAYRNSPLPRALALQRRLNVVGSVGGRLQLTTPAPDFNAAAAAFFRSWARECEYTDGLSFNEALQLIVTAVDTGGDCVVVHDAWTPEGGVLCGSGKLRIFESDEIADLAAADFAAAFGPGFTQRKGKVYDRFGRFVAIICSASQRGRNVFAAREGVIILRRDPAAPAAAAPWVYLADTWRPNQGRGVSGYAASVDLLSDYGDILASEASAAKLNAQLFGAYVKEAASTDADTTALDDYEIEETPDDESAEGGATVTAPDGSALTPPEEAPEFPDVVARKRGVLLDWLPDGYKAQIYDTKRPNDKVADFLDHIAGQISATVGVGRTYASLEPKSSYTAFRGAQLLARPSFVALQKTLERRVCDWIAVRILREALSLGLLPDLPAGADLYGAMVWSWPKQEEVDAVNEQNALTLRLRNGATTLREEFGPDWRDRIREIADEAEAMRAAGLIHPAAESASGQIVPGATPQQTPAAPAAPENPETEEGNQNVPN